MPSRAARRRAARKAQRAQANNITINTRNTRSRSVSSNSSGPRWAWDDTLSEEERFDQVEGQEWDLGGIVGEHVRLGDRNVFELDWRNWRREDGTTTTWECADIFDDDNRHFLDSWNRVANRERERRARVDPFSVDIIHYNSNEDKMINDEFIEVLRAENGGEYPDPEADLRRPPAHPFCFPTEAATIELNNGTLAKFDWHEDENQLEYNLSCSIIGRTREAPLPNLPRSKPRRNQPAPRPQQRPASPPAWLPHALRRTQSDLPPLARRRSISSPVRDQSPPVAGPSRLRITPPPPSSSRRAITARSFSLRSDTDSSRVSTTDPILLTPRKRPQQQVIRPKPRRPPVEQDSSEEEEAVATNQDEDEDEEENENENENRYPRLPTPPPTTLSPFPTRRRPVIELPRRFSRTPSIRSTPSSGSGSLFNSSGSSRPPLSMSSTATTSASGSRFGTYRDSSSSRLSSGPKRRPPSRSATVISVEYPEPSHAASLRTTRRNANDDDDDEDVEPLKELEDRWNKMIRATGAPGIKLVNDLDNDLPVSPALDFQYLEGSFVFTREVPDVIQDPSKLEGFLLYCDHDGPCTAANNCSCLKRDNKTPAKFRDNYDEARRLRQIPLRPERVRGIVECNVKCRCHGRCRPTRKGKQKEACQNRAGQLPREYPIEIFKTKKTGWGVRSSQDIDAGAKLGIYTGMITSKDSALATKSSATRYNFELHRSSEYFIVAYKHGNWTRFVNHSCEPNCVVIPVVYDTVQGGQPSYAPKLTFFTKQAIPRGTEFTIDYDPHQQSEAKRRCYCGTDTCRVYISV